MDNIIKIILRQSGGLAEMVKTIPLYVGMYNTAILDVYVPQSLVSEGISVKVGAILTANDGTKATTDSIPMTYKGEETFCNEQYTVYELNPFPANFLTYAGQQDLVVNIVTIENEEVASVITTQICKVDVLDSALIPDEELSTSAVDQFNARITANEQNIATNTENITANTGQIEQNTQDISSNTQRISDLEQTVSVGENYVGSLTVDTLVGIETKLNQLVQQVESRQPKNGDVVMVTLQITGQTDEIYKYYYTAGGWGNYQMPSIESASNTDKGIIQGTLGENKNTQVDITGGKINAIYVKDANENLRDIREYANTTKQSIDNIISGVTKVGHADKADKDENGNNIPTTYLTQNAGVTKTQMREYALPREFNDIYFLGKDGADTIISNEKPSSSLTWSESVSGIGTTELLSATFISNASFELSQKNSYQAVFYASADVNKTCQFRADIKYDNVIISTELSNEFVMVANNVYKVQFNANFNELQDVINYDGTKQLEIVLSVVTTDSGTATFTLYTNNNYISTFNLNTNKYTIATQSGYLGEIVEINSTGTLANGVVTFEIDRTIYNNTLIKFVLSYTGGNLNDYIKFVDSATNEEYYIKTPYNTNNRPQVKDLVQTSVKIEQNLVNIEFVGLVSVIEGYGTEIEVNMDNLAAMGGTTVYVNNTPQVSVNFDSDPQTQLNNKMDKANPTGTGSLSINRKANTTIGDYSVATGNSCEATGTASHAEGIFTEAIGTASHAEGSGTHATNSSHAEGVATYANGHASHAEGANVHADGRYSHAEGNFSVATHKSQHVFGEYNVADTNSADVDNRGTYVEIVGNGTANNARSNARTLDWNGNEVLAGTSQATGFKTANGTSSQFLKADGSVDSTTGTNITNLQNKVDFIKSDVVSGLDWATFNTSNFNTIFGTGWDAQLGNYGCRANTSDDTSGIASGFGFSGTYYAEFKVWYVGTTNAGVLITLSDSGTKNIATANVLVDRATNTDIHSNFFSPYAEKVDKTNQASKLYGTNSNGAQDLHTYSCDSATGWTFVQRDANGDVIVPSTPTSNNGATSKQYVNTYNMCPSDDNSLTVTATPVSGDIYFTAPANGMAYLRFNVSWNGQNYLGTIDFNIVGTNNNYLMYFSQEYYDTNPHVYMVNIPLKKGQKIKCNNLANININWGGMTFIKSEGQ